MNTELEILNTVNTFYSQSFNQLITITVAVLAFVGVILPILISVYQKRLFAIEHREIEQKLIVKIEAEFDKKVELLIEKHKEEMLAQEDVFDELKKDVTRKFNKLEGALLHVQAVNTKGLAIVSAYRDFMDSAISYIEAENNLNLRRVLTQVIGECLPRITKSDLEYDSELGKLHAKLIKKLKSHNTNGHYTDLIDDLELAFNQAKNRIEPITKQVQGAKS